MHLLVSYVPMREQKTTKLTLNSMTFLTNAQCDLTNVERCSNKMTKVFLMGSKAVLASKGSIKYTCMTFKIDNWHIHVVNSSFMCGDFI